MAAVRATRLYTKCWTCLSSSATNITARNKNLLRSLCSTVDQRTEQRRDEERQAADEVPATRKEFRRFRSRIYRQNRTDPDLERKARQGNLIIDLDEVHKVWLSREGFKHIHNLAKHYEIFEHVFGGVEFTPSKLMDISYGASKDCNVHWGNFITPSQALSAPSVNFESSSDLWSLILLNPDGNIWQEDAELLHWFVANIPGNNVSKGQEVIEYLPPIPPQGTGYHRYIYCLLQQKEMLDIKQLTSHDTSSQRSFKMQEMLARHKDVFTPAGLSFFQSAWDETVTKTYKDIIGTPEPVYDVKPFVTPTNHKKHTTREKFDQKYQNM